MAKDKIQEAPHLQLDKPKYLQKLDAVNAKLSGKAPDNAAIMALLEHIAEEQHEIKSMLKKLAR